MAAGIAAYTADFGLVRREASGALFDPDGEEAEHVQRIVDECVRHAKASRINVKLVDDPSRLEIVDDGVGISQAPGGRAAGWAQTSRRGRKRSVQGCRARARAGRARPSW